MPVFKVGIRTSSPNSSIVLSLSRIPFFSRMSNVTKIQTCVKRMLYIAMTCAENYPPVHTISICHSQKDIIAAARLCLRATGPWPRLGPPFTESGFVRYTNYARTRPISDESYAITNNYTRWLLQPRRSYTRQGRGLRRWLDREKGWFLAHMENRHARRITG